MCSIMLCSRLQRCLATPQTCVASAGKGRDTSKAAIVATSRALAACRNNSSTSICASTRSSTGWPTVAPPFSDHAITLGVPGHLVGTENRCSSPPTASYADQQQSSCYLHEWLEAALLQHAHLSTTTCTHSEVEGTSPRLQHSACNISATSASSSSIAAALQDKDWEQVQDMLVIDQEAEPFSSRSSPVASLPGGISQSLDGLEVPLAGLSDAAVVQDNSSIHQTDSSTDSGQAMESIDGPGVIVAGQDTLLTMDTSVENDSMQQDSSVHSLGEGWSVISAGSS